MRLHNIKKAVLYDVSEEKNHNAVNLDQLKAELLDCIQMQMTSQFDALKAEISNIAAPRAAEDAAEPPTKRRKLEPVQSSDEREQAEKLIESLRGQIEQLTKQHQDARDEADKAHHSSESLHHTLTELKHVHEENAQQLTKLSDENRTLSEHVTTLEAEHAKCKAAMASEAEQVQSLQEQLTKSRDELTALRTRAEAAERQLEVSEQRATELEQLFREEGAKSARCQDENVKMQLECDKLKVVCKQLYLQIKSNKSANNSALNNSGTIAASGEGQPVANDEPNQQ